MVRASQRFPEKCANACVRTCRASATLMLEPIRKAMWGRMDVLARREPMIRAIREALDRHEHEHADNDGRAVAAVLAVEPLIAQQLQGAVERVTLVEQALLLACGNEADVAARYLRMAQALDHTGGRYVTPTDDSTGDAEVLAPEERQ